MTFGRFLRSYTNYYNYVHICRRTQRSFLYKTISRIMKQKEIALALFISLTFLAFSIMFYTGKEEGVYFSCRPNISVPITILPEKQHSEHLTESDSLSAKDSKVIIFGAKNDTATVLENVCVHRLVDNTTFLTVYNARKTYSTSLYGFNIQFVASRNIPEDSVMLTNQTAYFMESFGSGNLHHFFNDLTFTLFALLQHFNGLHGTQNR